MSHRRDFVAVALAALLTGYLIGWAIINTQQPEPVTNTEVVKVQVISPTCARALDKADEIVKATAELADASNRLAPLVASAYAAGLAGEDSGPVVERVSRLNIRITEAHKAAVRVPSQYERLATECRQERTP